MILRDWYGRHNTLPKTNTSPPEKWRLDNDFRLNCMVPFDGRDMWCLRGVTFEKKRMKWSQRLPESKASEQDLVWPHSPQSPSSSRTEHAAATTATTAISPISKAYSCKLFASVTGLISWNSEVKGTTFRGTICPGNRKSFRIFLLPPYGTKALCALDQDCHRWHPNGSSFKAWHSRLVPHVYQALEAVIELDNFGTFLVCWNL